MTKIRYFMTETIKMWDENDINITKKNYEDLLKDFNLVSSGTETLAHFIGRKLKRWIRGIDVFTSEKENEVYIFLGEGLVAHSHKFFHYGINFIVEGSDKWTRQELIDFYHKNILPHVSTYFTLSKGGVE